MMKQLLFLFLFIVSCSKFESQGNIADLPQSKVSEIKSFIKGKKYNQDLAVFINFKIHSGKYRYFVYDLKNDKILQKAIVSHGSGSVIQNSKELRFSNAEGSYQSSLSLGCPMLSANAFNQTAKYIDQSKQPIILYTFY